MNENNKDQQIAELYLLQRVAKRINSILDIDILLEEIMSDVVKTFGYTRASILLKDIDTNELVIAAVRGWPTNYHVRGDHFKIGEYGMIGHVGKTEATYYAPDVTVDPYYQVSVDPIQSELDIPLKSHGKLIGVLSIQHEDCNGFSPESIQLLEALAEYVSTAIVNVQLFQTLQREKERIAEELEEAHTVQVSLLPHNVPVIPGFEISGICQSCREVGGDWYDFIQLSGGRVAIVLADVSGKAMAAALLMASTRAILRLYAQTEHTPSGMLSHINRILLDDFPDSKFVTMVYAILDPLKKTIVFAIAGHPSPLYVTSDGVDFLPVHAGLPLGIRDDFYEEHVVDMQKGSSFLLYSDGISEAMNKSSEEYGLNRIREHFSDSVVSAKSLIDAVHSFTSGFPATDDITVVLIQAK